MNINDVIIGNRTRKEIGDIKALAASIKHLGLLHPIVIDAEHHLIAGQRRLEACKSLGWDQVPVHVVPLEDILRGELDENVLRQDFTPSEKYKIAKRLEEREREAAKNRQREHGGTAPGRPKNTSANLAGVKGESRAKAAKAAGIGHTTLKRIGEVCQAAEENPEKYGHLVDEMDRIGKVDGVYRKLRAELEAERRPMAELRTPEDFAAAISTRWEDYFANVFRAGWLLVEMRDRGNGALAEVCANEKLQMKQRTAQKLMAVAENETLADPAHWSQLPADLDALYELSRVPDHVVEGWWTDGAANSDTNAKKVRQLRVLEKRDHTI